MSGGRLACLVLVSLSAAGCKEFINAMNAQAEQDRLVTVTVIGAVINPTNQEGRGWDDPPGNSAPLVTEFAGMVANTVVTGETGFQGFGTMADQLTQQVSTSLIAAWDKPDPTGTVEVYDHQNVAKYELPTKQDTLAPQWYTRIPNVPIHRAQIFVRLKDADFAHQDDIATITFQWNDLMAIEAQGNGAYVIDSTGETMGMVHRFVVSIGPN